MHNGIKYRSLLEAKWASFFTRIGWQYEYEPFEGNGYIPDFLIHGDKPLLVEIKPAATRQELLKHTDKMERGLRGIWSGDLLVVGVSPFVMPDAQRYMPVIGLLGEASADDAWDWGSAEMFACTMCRPSAPSVCHEYMSFTGRPCGHYDGDHHRGALLLTRIQHEWKQACNEVQWRGAA
jgi:hypothetical protein